MTTLSDIRKRVHKLDVAVTIGKNGLTPEVIKEIKKRLHRVALLKIKFSPSKTKEKRDRAQEIARLCGATFIHTIGYVVVIADPRTISE